MTQIKDYLSWKYFPYFAIILTITLPWFFHPGYLFMTDMGWGPIINVDWTSNWFLLNLIIKTFSFVFPVAFLEKIFIGFSVLVVLIGGRRVAECFTKDRLAIFAVSLFALFNPFIYDRLLYGQLGVVLAFGFFMISAAYLLEYLNGRERKKILLFGVFVALTLQIAVHFLFFSGLIFLLFLIIYFKKWKLDDWKHFVRNLLIAGAICVLLNSNWLVADMYGKSDTYNYVDSGITTQDLQAFKTSGSSDSEVIGNVAMMSGFWGKDQFRYMDLTKMEGNWGRSFLFLLPIVILGLVAGIRKKETRFMSVGLLMVFLISVLLAAGVASSFTAPLAYWLFDHFPFYKGLRESQKWVAVIVLVYTIFLAMGISALLKTKTGTLNRRVILIIMALVIIMQAPLLLWGFGRQVKPVSYPNDWVRADKSLVCSKNDQVSGGDNGTAKDQALFLPWHMYMSFNWIGHVVGNPAKSFFTCPVISGLNMEWGGIYDNSQDAQGKKVQEWLNSKGKDTSLLNSRGLGIKYIILAKEVDWQKYLWIGSSTDVTLTQDTKTLRVYEVK